MSKLVQYRVRSKGAPLEAVSGSQPPVPGPHEILIRQKAVAVNPADCKMIDVGHRVTAWPLVAGLDGSGVIEDVGKDVSTYKIGDEVLAMYSIAGNGGSFQTFSTVSDAMVAKKPSAWSFEEAASLTVSYYTAVAALGTGLRIPLPFIEGGPKAGFEPSSVLILGGSSALGAATIQLLRLARPKCNILTTSSPKHHSMLLSLGASQALDRGSSSLITEIKSATTGSQGVDAIVDVVGAGSAARGIFEALDPSGPKRYAQVWTGEDEIQVPEGVESILFRSRDLGQMQGGGNAMLGLQKLLQDGKYGLPLPVHKVGVGFEGLQKGLDLMRKGVSGEKIVVSL